MIEDADLVEGRFYWVLIVNDVDTDEAWENEPMPARYAGNNEWFYLGMEGKSDWPVRAIYKEIRHSA